MGISLEKLLSNTGPCLSSDLTDALVEKYNYSKDAARQKVSRAGGDIFKLKGLFPRKTSFVYLKSQFGSHDYWRALHDALLKTNSACGHAMSALYAREGMMPLEHFKISCGSPLKQKKHSSPEQIIDRLKYARIVKSLTLNDQEILYLAHFENHKFSKISEMQGRLSAEKILLTGLYRWCRNLGLVSFNHLKIRDKGELPVVSTTAWDLAGPSYLSGLVSFDKKTSKVKQGFIAMDVLLNQIVREEDVKPFIKKVEALKQLKNVGPCIHFFVAFDFSSGAFKLLKENGVSPATVNNLFGKDIAEGLTSFIHTLINAAKVIESPEKLDEVFEKLGKLEGATSQIRGALFEFLVAEVIRVTTNASYIELNKVVRTIERLEAEVDVFAPQSVENCLLFAECKGYNPNAYLPESEIDKWLDKRIPTIRKYCLENSELQNKKLIFQLWSTAKLDENSRKKIEEAISTKTKYQIEIFDQIAITKLLKEKKLEPLFRTYKTHFLGLPSH